MKIFLKLSFTAFAALALVCCMTACGDNPDIDETAKEEAYKAITEQYVDKTVLSTYANLSKASMDLYASIVALKAGKTDANLQKAADNWIKARNYWEKSEAFLFGPVDQLGIDPHIDTWPMAVDAFNSLMANETLVRSYGAEDGDIKVSSTENEDGLLGFHSIEYIIFRNGSVRNASDITELELIYAVAVAGDLRNQCCLIEVGWLGETGISSEKLNYAKRAFNYAQLGEEADSEYAKLMKETPNATYKTALGSCTAILDGCITIADEVGSMKIGKPHTGEDESYIESPFSYNSQVDFAGNIASIENAYLGGADANNRGESVSGYIKERDAALDTQIKEKITDAITKIYAIDQFEVN
ncbi:MAG: peptidase M75, partial [Tannerella sp.]|nr:peptidase M75 [Tannerella sp.]